MEKEFATVALIVAHLVITTHYSIFGTIFNNRI
jgi:hypothetical protein